MDSTRSMPVNIFTEQESFLNKPHADFAISSYEDDEPENLHRVAAHRHTYYEIIWVKTGEGIHTIDFTDYKFKGPCLFLLHPQHIHTIRKDTATTGGVIKFSFSAFPADDDKAGSLLQFGVFDDIDVLPVITLTMSQAEDVGKLFDDLYKSYYTPSIFFSETFRTYLKLVLLKIYEVKKSVLPGDVCKFNDLLRFREFQQLLENGFKKYHETSYYAAQLNITSKTLSNLTKRCSGLAPSQLIRQRILLEAKRLLHHSAMPVKEIAHYLGFDDTSYFIRLFKQDVQSSPQQYRTAVLNK